MKVEQRGTLVVYPTGAVFITGYHFDAEGECFLDEDELNKVAFRAALLEIADAKGIKLVPEQDDQALLDAAILSTNAIAKAMVHEPVIRRPWWKAWLPR